MTDALLQTLAVVLPMTEDEELSCGPCFEAVDRYAEMLLRGEDAAAILPLVRDHLERCPECMDEFEGLMDALRATTR